MSLFKKLFSNSSKPLLANELDNTIKFGDKLEKFGYFKYAELNDLDELRSALISSVSELGILTTIEDETTYLPKDYRLYRCDSEDLFEGGGFLSMFKELNTLFNKMGIIWNISNHYEEWNDEKNWLDHWITINEKEYILFKNYKGTGWDMAAVKLAEIINDQFSIQGKEEKLYLINGGNDGCIIFLTDEQFNLIDSFLKIEVEKPLEVEYWKKLMRVNE